MSTDVTPVSTEPAPRARLPRSTGALSGLAIILLGIWGGVIPFVGPYFHYAFGGYGTWHYTTERLWLDILPGAAAVLAGVLMLASAGRTSGLLAGWIAITAGVWFAIGPVLSLLWHAAGNPIGPPTGGPTRQALELIGYFYALGVLIAAFAAFAMGRFFSRPRVAAEPVVATGADEPATATGEPTGFGRRPLAT